MIFVGNLLNHRNSIEKARMARDKASIRSVSDNPIAYWNDEMALLFSVYFLYPSFILSFMM